MENHIKHRKDEELEEKVNDIFMHTDVLRSQ